MSSFSERLETVKERIAAACSRAGRDVGDVRVIAVAKKYGPDAVREAAEAGIEIIGENRVQEARQKIPECPGHLEWHLIGHLQKNKVRHVVELFSVIHSLDSLRILEAVNEVCEEVGKVMTVCLEVNVSGEATKYGLAPDEVLAILAKCGSLMNIDVVGLMTMPPFTEDPEGARPYFKLLREYRDQWSKETGFDLGELSMGMSNDFEVAIEEGATWIRLGKVLFGERVRE